MKRLLVLMIALVYLAVSSGFTVHMHYCMGHFVKATFVEDEQDVHECSHCGMTKKKGGNGCCKDEHKIIKNDADHSLAKEIKAPAAQIAYLPPAVTFHNPVNTAVLAARIVPSFQAHAPPDPYDCPLYLKIRNLRI